MFLSAQHNRRHIILVCAILAMLNLTTWLRLVYLVLGLSVPHHGSTKHSQKFLNPASSSIVFIAQSTYSTILVEMEDRGGPGPIILNIIIPFYHK